MRAAKARFAARGLGCDPGAHRTRMQKVRIRANTRVERFEDLLATMDKRSPSDRGICTKFDLPAINRAGCDELVKLAQSIPSNLTGNG